MAYFVSGYIARSILRRRKFVSCKDTLIDVTDAPDIKFCIPDKRKDIFEVANRGGLSAPSEYHFVLTTLATKYTAVGNKRSIIMLEFMKQGNQQQLFIKAVCEVIRVCYMFQCLLTANCANQHFNCETILKSVFICFVKNELKRLNRTFNLLKVN